MIDNVLVQKKLQELKLYSKELDQMKNISYQEFSESLGKQWMVYHGLQVSIQIILDVGNHILAAIGVNQVEDYADIIDRLGAQKIFSMDYAKRAKSMVGLRNILVHEYAKVDSKLVYSILQNNLNDFYQFIDYIDKFLNKIESKRPRTS